MGVNELDQDRWEFPYLCPLLSFYYFVLELLLGFTCGVAKFDISIAISCMLDVLGNGGFFLICVRGLLIKISILHLNAALPCPNLSFIYDISFASVIAVGFRTCFSGCIFGSKPLPMLCTSGNLIPQDFA